MFFNRISILFNFTPVCLCETVLTLIVKLSTASSATADPFASPLSPSSSVLDSKSACLPTSVDACKAEFEVIDEASDSKFVFKSVSYGSICVAMVLLTPSILGKKVHIYAL